LLILKHNLQDPLLLRLASSSFHQPFPFEGLCWPESAEYLSSQEEVAFALSTFGKH
jgi:hypothetical protein